MSQENVEIVREAVEVWNESGWHGVIEAGIVHAQVEYHDDPNWLGARSAHGIPAFLQRWDEIVETVGRDAHMEVEHISDAPANHVVLISRYRSAGETSGVPVQDTFGYLFRIRGKQIDYLRVYLDPKDALEAAGLRE
ncbi:MAG: nuclear transport factor 2 family protein [bacterium]